jgi:hypothetical protein
MTGRTTPVEEAKKMASMADAIYFPDVPKGTCEIEPDHPHTLSKRTCINWKEWAKETPRNSKFFMRFALVIYVMAAIASAMVLLWK